MKDADFVVDRDSESLKGSACWMLPAARGCRDGTRNARRKVSGRGERTIFDDRSCDATGVAFFSEVAEDAGEVLDAGLIDELCCGANGIGTHSHVQWPGTVIREPSGALVELVRRNTEIEKDGIDGVRNPGPLDNRGKVREVVPDNGEAFMVERLCDSIRVAVDTDNASVCKEVKNCTAMPSPAEGRVDDHLGIDRREEAEHFVDHHGLVIAALRMA